MKNAIIATHQTLDDVAKALRLSRNAWADEYHHGTLSEDETQLFERWGELLETIKETN
jgi:hypothetical protein